MSPVISAYNRLVSEGVLAKDPAQANAAALLSTLADRLRGYDPTPKRGLFGTKQMKAPNGLYLWGGVGAGKSLLMDLFFENAPVAKARRIHFHAFMAEAHRLISNWRTMPLDDRKAHPHRLKGASLDDPIPHTANALFSRAHLLCFDEFQVSDITDAMLLGRLFDQLFELGAVVVATSNRHPDDLYLNGLNRQLFLPAIALLKSKLKVHKLKAARDYRLDRLEKAAVYFTPLSRAATASMDQAFADMTAGASPQRVELDVGRRRLIIPRAARGVARGDFTHWTSNAFGPADYLRLATEYPVVLIDNIPIMSPAMRNEAKRFVTFIDALYEARVKLICSADAEPENLYPSGDGSFEFERTASRLFEMRSTDYLALEHISDADQRKS